MTHRYGPSALRTIFSKLFNHFGRETVKGNAVEACFYYADYAVILGPVSDIKNSDDCFSLQDTLQQRLAIPVFKEMLQQKKRIIIPVIQEYRRRNHWVSILVDLETKTITIIDSKQSMGSRVYPYRNTREAIGNVLTHDLLRECEIDIQEPFSWTQNVLNLAIQDDDVNCGPISTCVISMLAHGCSVSELRQLSSSDVPDMVNYAGQFLTATSTVQDQASSKNSDSFVILDEVAAEPVSSLVKKERELHIAESNFEIIEDSDDIEFKEDDMGYISQSTKFLPLPYMSKKERELRDSVVMVGIDSIVETYEGTQPRNADFFRHNNKIVPYMFKPEQKKQYIQECISRFQEYFNNATAMNLEIIARHSISETRCIEDGTMERFTTRDLSEENLDDIDRILRCIDEQYITQWPNIDADFNAEDFNAIKIPDNYTTSPGYYIDLRIFGDFASLFTPEEMKDIFGKMCLSDILRYNAAYFSSMSLAGNYADLADLSNNPENNDEALVVENTDITKNLREVLKRQILQQIEKDRDNLTARYENLCNLQKKRTASTRETGITSEKNPEELLKLMKKFGIARSDRQSVDESISTEDVVDEMAPVAGSKSTPAPRQFKNVTYPIPQDEEKLARLQENARQRTEEQELMKSNDRQPEPVADLSTRRSLPAELLEERGNSNNRAPDASFDSKMTFSEELRPIEENNITNSKNTEDNPTQVSRITYTDLLDFIEHFNNKFSSSYSTGILKIQSELQKAKREICLSDRNATNAAKFSSDEYLQNLSNKIQNISEERLGNKGCFSSMSNIFANLSFWGKRKRAPEAEEFYRYCANNADNGDIEGGLFKNKKTLEALMDKMGGREIQQSNLSI